MYRNIEVLGEHAVPGNLQCLAHDWLSHDAQLCADNALVHEVVRSKLFVLAVIRKDKPQIPGVFHAAPHELGIAHGFAVIADRDAACFL